MSSISSILSTASRNFQVQFEMAETSEMPTVIPLSSKIFGIYHKFQIFSPFNCGSPKPIRYFSICFTILSIISMTFRTYWMFWQTGSEILKFGWAETNMYAFLSFESLIITIALLRITWNRSLEKFEKNLQVMKSLRISKEPHKIFDNYRILYIRIFIGCTFLFVTFILSAVYLAIHKKVGYGNTKQSSWYWIMDPIVAILCGYSNFLYLPTHSLTHHAITREFDVFNEEMEEMSKNKQLANPITLRQFAYRQLKLFEFSNYMTTRMHRLMAWAPFFALLALLMSTYITTQFDKTPPVLYHICLIALTISSFVMSFTLLYPVAFVQEAMCKASNILLNDPLIQNSDDILIYQTYRIISDRAMFNRTCNNVLNVFSVNRKNIERTFFIHSLFIIVMIAVYSFQEGLEEGFGGLEKFAEKVGS